MRGRRSRALPFRHSPLAPSSFRDARLDYAIVDAGNRVPVWLPGTTAEGGNAVKMATEQLGNTDLAVSQLLGEPDGQAGNRARAGKIPAYPYSPCILVRKDLAV